MKHVISDEQLIELIEEKAEKKLEELVASDETLKERVADLRGLIALMENPREVEVPESVKNSFELALTREQYRVQSGRWPWMQVAAAIGILLLGFSLGKWTDTRPDALVELAALKTEIQQLRESTLTNTLQKHSASERIQAVSIIEEKQRINTALIMALVATLNGDESPNVRYAALQALGKFIGHADVRAELVKSLESQSDALIQISLINLLVDSQERSAIAPIKELLEKEEVTPEVKKQAEIALRVLS